MVAQRYEISLLVLKTISLRSLVKYFSTLEDEIIHAAVLYLLFSQSEGKLKPLVQLFPPLPLGEWLRVAVDRAYRCSPSHYSESLVF